MSMKLDGIFTMMTELQIALCMVLSYASLSCAQEASQKAEAKDRRILVVLGTPGEEKYGEAFRKWAENWRVAAANSEFTLIDGTQAIDGEAGDRQQLLDWIAAAKDSGVSEHWLVLMGHGTSDASSSKFNLRGRDVEAKELGKTLHEASGQWVIINCASSSGPFINALSAKDRVVVTATKSGSEQNYARFGEYFSQSIADLSADLDHDRSVSVLEAFLAASGKVSEFYREEDRLASEQALLDDNADKRGTPASFYRGVRPVKAPAQGLQLDGKNANRFGLMKAEGSVELSAEQRARRDQLELQIEVLRSKKKDLEEDEYYRQLEEIFTELAKVSQAHPPA